MGDMSKDIGLDKEAFVRAKKLAAEIMDLTVKESPPFTMIEVYTALALVAGGLVRKESEEIQNRMIDVSAALIRTSIKTYNEFKPQNEAVH